MRSFDLAPLYRATVGFDQIADLMDRVMSTEATQTSYPPIQYRENWRTSMAHLARCCWVFG